MYSARFEPAIPVIEQLQAYDLDRAATGMVTNLVYLILQEIIVSCSLFKLEAGKFKSL